MDFEPVPLCKFTKNYEKQKLLFAQGEAIAN
jgi:hypothetical protein